MQKLLSPRLALAAFVASLAMVRTFVGPNAVHTYSIVALVTNIPEPVRRFSGSAIHTWNEVRHFFWFKRLEKSSSNIQHPEQLIDSSVTVINIVRIILCEIPQFS